SPVGTAIVPKLRKIQYGSTAQSVETSINIIEFVASCLDASSIFESAGRGRGTEQSTSELKNNIWLGSSVGRAKD
ncbi:hypothetical protein, partial [Geobacillus subterraneus]|uniref:hypothetical protein n=1 Tax=Geobacillus subterraneus TaxID=129338 RepID=UPI001C12CC66